MSPAGCCILTIRRKMGNLRNVIPAAAGNAYLYAEVGNRTGMMVTDVSDVATDTQFRGSRTNRKTGACPPRVIVRQKRNEPRPSTVS